MKTTIIYSQNMVELQIIFGQYAFFSIFLKNSKVDLHININE